MSAAPVRGQQGDDRAIPEWVIRVLVTLLPIGAGAAGLGTTLFGQLLFMGFEQNQGLIIPDSQNISAELYKSWSQKIFTGSAQASPGFWSVVPIVAIVLLVIHVASRRSIHRSRGTNRQGETAGTRRVRDQLMSAYYGHYFTLTVVLALGGFVSLFYIAHPFWLVATVGILAIPSIWYLYTYTGDLRSTHLGSRVTYVCLVLFSLGSVIALPYQYGRAAFDLNLRKVTKESGRSDISGVFVLQEQFDSAGERPSILAEFKMNASNGQFSMNLRQASRDTEMSPETESLRHFLRAANQYEWTPVSLSRDEFARGIAALR